MAANSLAIINSPQYNRLITYFPDISATSLEIQITRMVRNTFMEKDLQDIINEAYIQILLGANPHSFRLKVSLNEDEDSQPGYTWAIVFD